MDDTNYNDSNRAFLQAFLARGAMTFEEAQPILAAIFSIQGGYTLFLVHHMFALRSSCGGPMLTPKARGKRSSSRRYHSSRPLVLHICCQLCNLTI